MAPMYKQAHAQIYAMQCPQIIRLFMKKFRLDKPIETESSSPHFCGHLV